MAERVGQVVDLVGREREPQRGVGVLERPAPVLAQRDRRERPWRDVGEKRPRIRDVVDDRLGHPVVHERQQSRAIGRREALGTARRDVERDAALDARDPVETAVARDLGCLRRPRRDRADARDDHESDAGRLGRSIGRPVSQQALERLPLGIGELASDLDEMPVPRADAGDPVRGSGRGQGGKKFRDPERR